MATKDEGTPINLSEKVTIYSTKDHPHAAGEGKELIVHPTMAEKLIKQGWATEKQTKAKEAK